MDPEVQKLERLVELAAVLGEQNDYQEILRVVTQQAAGLLKAEVAIIMMVNPKTRQTVKTIFKEELVDSPRQYHAEQTHVSGWIMKNMQPFVSAELKTDPRFTKKFFENSLVTSVMGVPLRAEGILLGTFILFNMAGDKAALEEELAYFQKFAAIVSPFLRNVQKIQQYFEASLPQSALLAKYEAVGLLGKSAKFIELLQAIEAAAQCQVRVLLVGQSGSGKELVARAIHRFSSRSDHPFVAIDCGAIPASLIESELFGHVKGAFTGAAADRKGLLQEADQGTLFMDEIANLPLEMQAKLMRFLQEGEVRPLGSNRTTTVDVRIISASSASLRQMVEKQQFREDLFYRLHVYPIQIPSLDDRREDIPLLANHFLEKFASQQGKQAKSFHGEVLDFMRQRQWAGNIRELENFVERLVALAAPSMTTLNRDLLPPDLQRELQKLNRSPKVHTTIKSLQENLSEYEAGLIQQVLLENAWNKAKTARALKISEPTLRYKMSKLGIVRAEGVERRA
jgi:Nif-specific regulatory protein